MTEQEQDAILGRTRREYREAKSKLGALKKRNSEIATIARKLADAIEGYPDRLMVGNLPQGSLALSITNPKHIYTPEDAGQLSHESLCVHLAEYIKVKDAKDRLRQALIDQGEDDPEA